MVKKSINEKIKIVGFWTGGGIFCYLLIAFILKSKYPIFEYSFNLDNAYDVIKEALTLAAAFLAPIAAFLLFSDWREQHNKQVRNEFALKVFNQFENLSNKINQASYIFLDLEIIIPDESSDINDPNRIPLYLSDPIFKENSKLLNDYENQILVIQEEFNVLLDKLRYFGFVVNQVEKTGILINYFIKNFSEIHNEEDDSYSEYLQFIEVGNRHLESYKKLRNEIEQLIVKDILNQLQEI